MSGPFIKRDLEVDDLVARAGDSSAKLAVVRDQARDRAVKTIRAVEAAAGRALRGDHLRGLESLLPAEYGTSFPGAVVGGSRERGIDTFLPKNGKPMLVWDKDARLLVAWKEGGAVRSHPVRDDEISAQVLEPVLFALTDALLRHLEKTTAAAANYATVLDLCDRIDAALEEK